MHAVHDASHEGRRIEVTSRCERPTQLSDGEFKVRKPEAQS
jgi:hypothetical protein